MGTERDIEESVGSDLLLSGSSTSSAGAPAHPDSTVTGNIGVGIEVNGTVNLIIRNSTRGNSLGNFDIVSGNRAAIIVGPTTSGAITNHGPGSGPGTTDPWANFAFQLSCSL